MGPKSGDGFGGEKSPLSVHSLYLSPVMATFILSNILIVDVKVVKAFESALALLGGL